MSARKLLKQRKFTKQGMSLNSQPPRNDSVGGGHLFGSWSLIERDPHPESRGYKAKAAANQSMDLKFG